MVVEVGPEIEQLVFATSGPITGSATLIAVVSTAGTIPRFAYAANNADSTISVYTTNPATGQLRANGYALAGKLPQGLVVDPRGKFVYATSSGDNTFWRSQLARIQDCLLL